jgi:hypothetical protein
MSRYKMALILTFRKNQAKHREVPEDQIPQRTRSGNLKSQSLKTDISGCHVDEYHLRCDTVYSDKIVKNILEEIPVPTFET